MSLGFARIDDDFGVARNIASARFQDARINIARRAFAVARFSVGVARIVFPGDDKTAARKCRDARIDLLSCPVVIDCAARKCEILFVVVNIFSGRRKVERKFELMLFVVRIFGVILFAVFVER